eukprot:Hpha_TRINITY_DN3466_c0_g1::TRINITY_DN3466_c0_g1_i1::g.32595::m.32595
MSMFKADLEKALSKRKAAPSMTSKSYAGPVMSKRSFSSVVKVREPAPEPPPFSPHAGVLGVDIGNEWQFSKGKVTLHNRHQWTMFVRPAKGEDPEFWEKAIEKVVFRLHKSFSPPVVELTSPPFTLQRTGWGTFGVGVEIYLKKEYAIGDMPHTFTHPLEFGTRISMRRHMLPAKRIEEPSLYDTDLSIYGDDYEDADDLMDLGLRLESGAGEELTSRKSFPESSGYFDGDAEEAAVRIKPKGEMLEGLRPQRQQEQKKSKRLVRYDSEDEDEFATDDADKKTASRPPRRGMFSGFEIANFSGFEIKKTGLKKTGVSDLFGSSGESSDLFGSSIGFVGGGFGGGGASAGKQPPPKPPAPGGRPPPPPQPQSAKGVARAQ